MNVQRSAFLMLAAAMAAQACVVKETPDKDEGSGGSRSGTGGDAATSGGKTGSGGAATGGAKASGGSMADAGDASTGDATTGDAATGDASMGDASTGEATTGDAATGEGGACDDTVGTAGDCTAIEWAANCGASSWEEDYCNAAKISLKPGVAKAAVACMLTITDCNTSAVDPYACVQTALNGACPDSTRDTLCTEAVTACGDVDTAQCHALVDGLSAQGATDLHSCIELGCTYGLWSCIEGLQ